ncbi:unnamed protein product [Clonostachys rhizophaga]|uniref:GH16 domain-containing protein n=1 Tax=Clonostachys rhizophaga TaxID=160324 RepID=A0A9N9VU11_9HYPO|nr:unnamed protein product [Clonostachys rhizophaga]
MLLWIVFPVIVKQCSAQVTVVNSSTCGCFLTNGSTPTYYSDRIFFDFRQLSQFSGVPDLLKGISETTKAMASSDYFSSTDWTDVWSLQRWSNKIGKGDELRGDASYLMLNTLNNVYIEKNNGENSSSDTFLTLRTSRQNAFQSVAEFQTAEANYKYLSIRMLSRTIGSPGACTAMFTYRDTGDGSKVQEADIEMLTSGPKNRIQYTNQPSYNENETFPEATRNGTLPNGILFSDWVVHRLDWTPDRSVWYVDGQETANIKFQTPRDASRVHFNTWSNGGSWTGKMLVGGEAFMQIQWIEMVYNTTTENVMSDKERRWAPGGVLSERGATGHHCQVVCSIDESNTAGEIALLWDSEAAHMFAHQGLWRWSTLTLPVWSLVTISLVI